MFGSTKRPGMRGTSSLNMGAYYGYGSDQLIVSPTANAVQAAVAPTETSPLYKFGMSPTLWALAAIGGVFAYRHFKKKS